MTNGASRSRLREYNARTVIHALRRGGPASQSEIAERAGLSVPAVSAIMRSLTEEGYIREVRSDNPGRGRPRVIVDVVPEAAYSLGIHIDPSLITAVLLDLRGNVVEVNHSPEVDPSDPTRTLRVAAGMARAVTPDGSRGDRVVGACLAVPGRVDSVIGGIADSVWLPGWNGRPLGPILAASIGREVRVVVDTYAAMVGEQWVRGGDLLEATSVFVYLGVGTGLGLTVAGAATSGGSGNAGQVGRIFEIARRHARGRHHAGPREPGAHRPRSRHPPWATAAAARHCRPWTVTSVPCARVPSPAIPERGRSSRNRRTG